jgi:hypothetical protein
MKQPVFFLSHGADPDGWAWVGQAYTAGAPIA